jgi:hypothetical protein
MGGKSSNGREALDTHVERFISRWQGREGGQERANYALFLTELCDLLGLPHPDPASAAHPSNDYVFERVVRELGRDERSTANWNRYQAILSKLMKMTVSPAKR